MVSIDRVQSGISRYLDNEVVPKMSGANRWIFSAAAAAYVAEAPNRKKSLQHTTAAS